MLKKKYRFVFKKLGYKFRTCRIYLKKSHSNIFITMTDLRDKVIICKTSGSSGVTGNKRRKKVPQVIELIFKEVLKYLQHYKIFHIDLVLKMRVNVYYYILMKELSYYGISVVGFTVRRKVPHMGLRVES